MMTTVKLDDFNLVATNSWFWRLIARSLALYRMLHFCKLCNNRTLRMSSEMQIYTQGVNGCFTRRNENEQNVTKSKCVCPNVFPFKISLNIGQDIINQFTATSIYLTNILHLYHQTHVCRRPNSYKSQYTQLFSCV